MRVSKHVEEEGRHAAVAAAAVGWNDETSGAVVPCLGGGEPWQSEKRGKAHQQTDE